MLPKSTDVVLGGQLKPTSYDVVLSKPFDYDKELKKLKGLSQHEFLKLIGKIQHTKNFSSYYVPKWDVLSKYFTNDELTYLNMCINLEDQRITGKLIEIQDCFSEAGNYHYSKMYLSPKLNLFSKLTEWIYLIRCFIQFTYYFPDVNCKLEYPGGLSTIWNKLAI